MKYLLKNMSKFNKPKLVRVDLYISNVHNEKLDNLSKQLLMSKSLIMRLALDEYLNKGNNKST